VPGVVKTFDGTIRQHLNEVKDCYEMELSRKPSLQGRVTVQFTIVTTGQVITAVVQSSTLGNTRVENCVVNAVRRWAFLKPSDGGIAIVSYPFNFTAGTGALPEPAQAMVAPSSFWDTSASILRERSDLPSRVAKVAEAVSAPKETRPALLAWLLVEHHLRPTTAPVAAYLVIANLLKEANSLDDAVRILSEVALFDPDLAAAELRRPTGRRRQARGSAEVERRAVDSPSPTSGPTNVPRCVLGCLS
jgi:TonB family protein